MMLSLYMLQQSLSSAKKVEVKIEAVPEIVLHCVRN